MKKLALLISLCVATVFTVAALTNVKNQQPLHLSKVDKKDVISNLQEGDLIFQISQSSQCIAVQAATKSVYSHCGIVFTENGKWVVYEAVQPVSITPLQMWIDSGKDSHFVLKRLKNSESLITSDIIQAMKKEAKQHVGKNYDLTFEWSDKKMYCSELIWKIYQRTLGIEIGKLEKLGDFDLTSPVVQQVVKQRYGNNMPYDETVISPISIMNSDQLITVK